MHGMVLLDEAGEVLRPAIIWCDQRSEEQGRAITAKVGAQRLIELTANPALTNFTLTKIWWVQQHEPQIWSRVRTVLLPKDYVRFRLTGARAIDVADASGTLLFDVVHRRWSAEMMEASSVRPEILPEVLESPEISGRVSPEGTRATGLREGTPVVAGAGDQAAGRGGHRNCAPWSGERHDRNFGSRVRGYQHSDARPKGPHPHFLPRRAGALARDGSHAGRRIFAALVP